MANLQSDQGDNALPQRLPTLRLRRPGQGRPPTGGTLVTSPGTCSTMPPITAMGMRRAVKGGLDT
jgi:hypothetical protein